MDQLWVQILMGVLGLGLIAVFGYRSIKGHLDKAKAKKQKKNSF